MSPPGERLNRNTLGARRALLRRGLFAPAWAVTGILPAQAQAQAQVPAQARTPQRVDLSLTIQLPAGSEAVRQGQPASDQDRWVYHLEKTLRISDRGLPLTIVPAGMSHRLRVEIEGGQVWLLGARDGESLDTPGIRPERLVLLGELAQDVPIRSLRSIVRRVGRHLNLMRLHVALQATGPAQAVLDLSLHLKRAALAARAVDVTQIVPLRDKDQITLKLRNAHARRQVVTVVYVDARFDNLILDGPQGQILMLEPGESGDIAVSINADTYGNEELLVIAIEDESLRTDLGFLAWPPNEFPGDISRTRSGKARDIFKMAAVAEAEFLDRRVMQVPVPPGTWMQRIRLQVDKRP